MYVDVSSYTNYEQAFLRCKEHFGGIDVVVNNAGVNGDANWESMININLKVGFFVALLNSCYVRCITN